MKKVFSIVLFSMFVMGLSNFCIAEELTPALCKTKVESAVNLIKQEGTAAISKIKDEKGEFRFAEGKGYIWIQNLEGKMVMHPIKPSLDGKDLMNLRDVNGVFLFVEFNEICEENGEGWVPYSWPKPGQKDSSPKVSFVKHVNVEGKDLVLGSGMYDVTGDDIRKLFPKDVVADTE